MKIVLIPALCLGFWTVNSCNINAIHGSGVAKTETRSVAAFSKVHLAGSPDVEVTVGPTQSVSVTTDDNIITNIETKVRGETLEIGSKGSYNTSIGVKVKITVRELTDASVSGSGNIHATGLHGADMETGITGSGDITLKGSIDHLRAKITGSGSLEADDLTAKTVDVTVTGSGDARVHATDELDAGITGSGDVKYSGNPREVHKRVTGSGNIAQR